MPPLILPVIAGVAILGASGYTLDKLADALDEMNEGAKLALIGAGGYVAFRALKSSGVLK